MHATAGQALDNLFIIDGNFQYVINLDARLLQRFSLRNGARESVEQETVLAVILSDTLLDQADDQVVRHQAAAVHYLLDLQTHLGARLHRGTQHVASGYLRNAVMLADEL